MNASAQPPPMHSREGDWLKLRVLAAAFVASTLACALIAWFLSKAGVRAEGMPTAAALRTVFPVFVVVAVLCFLVSGALRRVMVSRALRRAAPEAKGAALPFGRYLLVVILTNALAEVPSLLGLVYFLLGGTFEDSVLFFAIAAVTHVGAFPRRWLFEDLNAALPVDEGTARGPAGTGAS
ncbi:MAG: hypothetical protein V2A58_12850 [Planctomycetota bacterium]